MEHTIKINIPEIIALGSHEDIKGLIDTVIQNEFTQKQYSNLIIEMLEDYNEYLVEFDKHNDIQKSINHVVEHLKSLD